MDKLKDDKEYTDMMEGMVDELCEMTRPEIANQMSETLDMAVHAFADGGEESTFNAMIYFSVLRGYFESHMRSDNPTPLQIAGMVSRSIDSYTELLIEATNKFQEEVKEDE